MTESDGPDNAISFIHALTKHLLHVPDTESQNIFIGVQPNGGAWKVRVSYSGFVKEVEAPKLSEALNDLVAILTAETATQLEEGAKLLGQT